jgi:hypothetical protein
MVSMNLADSRASAHSVNRSVAGGISSDTVYLTRMFTG